MQSEELKPCPFCGGAPTHKRFTGNGFTMPRVEYVQVRCEKCRIETQPFQPYGDEDAAISAWNRRAEAALSTDAEPVGMQHRYRTVGKHVGEWQDWQDGPAPKLLNVNYDIQERHVYAAPPAPAVAVKALLDDVWNAAVEKAAAIADDCVHLTPDPGAAIKTMLNGRAKLHPSSEAALSAQVQDVAGWCQPGDIKDRQFLVTFDDPDCRNSVFSDETKAREFWERMRRNWNCYLFGALPAAPAAKQGEAE